MPCFAHDGYHELPPVASGTTVLLDGAPASDTSPVVAYIWGPSGDRCGGHDAPAQTDIAITHQGTLTHQIHGFVSTSICRQTAGGAREILYSYPASGADVTNVAPESTSICD